MPPVAPKSVPPKILTLHAIPPAPFFLEAVGLVTLLLPVHPIYASSQQPAVETQAGPPVQPAEKSPTQTAEKPPAPTQENPAKPSPAHSSNHQNCLSIEEASQAAGQDICISAHVYNVVQLADGTRFLDVCPASLPDDQCHFTILCPAIDNEEVGSLLRFRDQQIQIRGMVHSMHGRMGIVLSHIRQFDGGPEKFRPNPLLLHGFNAQSGRMPVRDPNLARSDHHRSFMNSNDREALPSKR